LNEKRKDVEGKKKPGSFCLILRCLYPITYKEERNKILPGFLKG